MKAKIKFLATLSAVFVCGVASLQADTVPEPSTILYGKVLHRAYGNEHQLTEGSLEWTLRNQDGVEFTYSAELQDIKGVFSYKLAIPHQALSTGLEVDSDVLPLAQGEDEYEFVSIEVDGFPAAILWSEVDFLSLLQNSRAATHRIDLLVSFDLLDSDGDGMPDWWEKFYGLDWQLDDANLDPDGDGWTNLEEYLNGTDPLFDDRAPTVQTLELAAYGESNNGVWLRAVDADSTPAELEYTLDSSPEGGYLHRLDGPSGVETPLAIGATFTQSDLNEGKLAYRHSDPSVIETSFTVSLSDGVNDASVAEISISVFPPSTLEDLEGDLGQIPFWWRDENVIFEAYWGLRENVLSGELVESALLYLLGKDYGWTLWDQRLDTLPVTLSTTGAGSHFILGGAADDVLRGGAEGDILNGGEGRDTLTGGAGVDLFMIGDLGEEVITDFTIGDDVLDIADLVAGNAGDLNSFIQASFDGSNTTIGIDIDGSATAYTDAQIILEGVQLTQDDLHRLWSEGQLVSGAVQGRVMVAFDPVATPSIEEGFETAELILRRQGPTSLPLTVDVTYSGSATNGVDYQILFGTATFAAGEATTTITVEPLADGNLEGTEQFTASLLPGDDYVLGALTAGQVAIVDAKQRFNILAVEALTVVAGDPGLILVTRQGPINTSTTVFLDVDGSAVKGVDYQAIPTFISFAPYQTDFVIPVVALADGVLADEDTSRTVDVALKPSFSDSYFLGNASETMVRLLSNEAAFQAWVLANNDNADAGMTEDELKTVESSRTGIQSLLEYAMSYGVDFEDGLDAQEQAQFTPALINEGEDVFVEYTQRMNDPRLEYIVQVSKDLSTWNSGESHFEAVEVSEAEENAGRVRFRIVDADGNNCFVRVLVNLNN